MESDLSIVGLGWLGNILAEHFSNKGFQVHASTTTHEKSDSIREKGFVPYIFRLEDMNFPTGFIHSRIHILCIPPSKTSTEFLPALQHYLRQLKPETTVFLISSTGVYPASSGTYAEDAITVSGKMMDMEKTVQTIVTRHYILRCGGLIGEGRHPGNFLAGKSEVTGPLSTVNLIHAYDICFVIEKLLSVKNYGIFNISAQTPCCKREFYRKAAVKINQIPPVFIEESDSSQRKISSQKIVKITGATFSNTAAFFDEIMSDAIGNN